MSRNRNARRADKPRKPRNEAKSMNPDRDGKTCLPAVEKGWSNSARIIRDEAAKATGRWVAYRVLDYVSSLLAQASNSYLP